MKDWKIRQEMYHKLFSYSDMGDSLLEEEVIVLDDADEIVKKALMYPVEQSRTLYYPAKSYAIAITYAKLLEVHFQENFYECLDDKELLFNNDPYFVPYSENKQIYDDIIASFPWSAIENSSLACLNFQNTLNYFLKEFLLHDETKMYAPS